MSLNTGESRIESALKETFGHDHFRDGQENLIKAALDGQDCLGILPTNGGKSLCYQIPAVLGEGTTLLVQPLIALMEEQKKKMAQLGINMITISRRLSESERRQEIQRIKEGVADIVAVAPEALVTAGFQSEVQNVDFARAAIDEAHCTSTWGHSFRPDYLQVGGLLRNGPYGNIPQIGAYTATTNRKVTKDMLHYLGLKDPLIQEADPHRPNLQFERIFIDDIPGPQKLSTKRSKSFKQKVEKFAALIEETPSGACIFYPETIREANRALTLLEEMGYGERLAKYHSKMAQEDRREVEEFYQTFANPIIVATAAFGMGVDRPDVRLVGAGEEPSNLLDFAQKMGRSGRDGLPARCVFFKDPAALLNPRSYKAVSQKLPDIALLEKVFASFTKFGADKDATFDRILQRYKSAVTRQNNENPDLVNPDLVNQRIGQALNILKECRVVWSHPTGKGLRHEGLVAGTETHNRMLHQCQMHDRMLKIEAQKAAAFSNAAEVSQELMWELIAA